MDDRRDRMRWDPGTGSAPVQPYGGHGTRPAPHPDDTGRVGAGHRGGKASGVACQQLMYPPTSRPGRRQDAGHQHIGMVHELCPFRAARVHAARFPASRVHPQMHIAGERAGCVPAGGRIRIDVPLRGREQSVRSDESRAVRHGRAPDHEGRPVRVVTREYSAAAGPPETHRGPRNVRPRGREPVAHGATPLPAETSHRVSDGGSGGGATISGRAGSPSPSMR